jgi:PAP2 superfamily
VKKKKNSNLFDSQSSRRNFLGQIGGSAAALGLGGYITTPAQAQQTEALTPAQRTEQAYQVRVKAALTQKNLPQPALLSNGDEDRYNNRIGTFTKGLPHNQLGEVDSAAFQSLMYAVTNQAPEDFERVQLGQGRKLVNPQAGLAYEMMGADAGHLMLPPAPAFSSAEEASEIGEIYWQALTRDVHFSDYDSNPITAAAAADISRFSDFRGPKLSRRANTAASFEATEIDDRTTRAARQISSRRASAVTTSTLFRGNTPGDIVGPYLSQFLWLDVPFGAQTIVQKMKTVVAGDDYMTNYSEWLAVQNGSLPTPNRFDSTQRYIRNNRDLAQWVHVDALYQAYFNALFILLGMGAPADPANPYRNSNTQDAFGTFGNPHIQALMTGASANALRTVWYQKWYAHRRLRPEAFAGSIHNHVSKAANYPIHPDILNSRALTEVSSKFGTYLLPMAFPEGSPVHPAYGSGHATVAGACVTILKAWFDESWILPNPVNVSADGLSLIPYTGTEQLTVGGELNKLAANIGIGRNAAGVHWRSDFWEAAKLGEASALSILTDMRSCFNERFDGFNLTKFDGTKVTV